MKSTWFRVYWGLALVTLIFQIYVRSSQCSGLDGCELSFVKGAIWAFIWPASWVVYLAGLI